MLDLKRRQDLICTAVEAKRLGYCRGNSGNVSVRVDGGLLVTPSQVPFETLQPRDVVFVDFEGHVDGKHRPTSEWRIHRDVMESRPEVGAVVHAHPPFCTALACHSRDIPPFHYMIAKAGGDSIRCAAYALVASQALSYAVLQALDGRKACLMAHHGMVAVGKDLESALTMTVETEELAEQYWRALQIGEVPVLSKAQMREVLEQFKIYSPSR